MCRPSLIVRSLVAVSAAAAGRLPGRWFRCVERARRLAARSFRCAVRERRWSGWLRRWVEREPSRRSLVSLARPRSEWPARSRAGMAGGYRSCRRCRWCRWSVMCSESQGSVPWPACWRYCLTASVAPAAPRSPGCPRWPDSRSRRCWCQYRRWSASVRRQCGSRLVSRFRQSAHSVRPPRRRPCQRQRERREQSSERRPAWRLAGRCRRLLCPVSRAARPESGLLVQSGSPPVVFAVMRCSAHQFPASTAPRSGPRHPQ
jgi:hypothetical protein